eukprot:TRINITY_DN4754_c2_g2_i1.p2 TRINITY_DN4754_c2_g2~~TRINITY_DN4754_c2_g2_i1.p2  ORF type:complete len:306 (-),score=25.33 TRINITY_DN4754_c2_g2_i1:447-1364(-)
MPHVTRRPVHQGTWYESDERILRIQIQSWLDAVQDGHKNGKQNGKIHPKISAIIGPHAGYRYCGQVMAHAYQHLRHLQAVKRIFILGPSHNVYSDKLLLSAATEQSTPFGSIDVDLGMNQQLMQSGMFDYMPLEVEENEHSLEMHLPFLAYVLDEKKADCKVIPIMVGALSQQAEEEYGRLLAPLLEDEQNFFIISSDFCHWGRRFKYVYTNNEMKTISDSIEWLDGLGMRLIEQMDPVGFANYLRKYGNTICGRHPIAVFLNMISHCRQKFNVTFIDYQQSGKCVSMADSSVSYAAAVVHRQHN